FSSRRRHTIFSRDWSSDVCSSDLVMFHEVAHGLGIKQTINGKGFVREALQEQYSWLEECKADILGLYMVTKLLDEGELDGAIERSEERRVGTECVSL